MDITVSDTAITTTGEYGYGIYGLGNTGDVNIKATNSTITTSGLKGSGIYGLNSAGEGDVTIGVSGGAISTTNNTALKVTTTTIGGEEYTYVEERENHAIFGSHTGTGALEIRARDGFSFETTGPRAYGVYGNRTHPAAGLSSTSMAVTMAVKSRQGVSGLTR